MGGPSSSGGGNDTDVSGAEAVATNYKYTTASSKKINKNKKPADYNPEKDDTAAKLDLFHNDPYTRDQGGPYMLRPLEFAFDAGSKKTREFFTDKVLESKRAKSNIGYTKDEFSKLNRTNQEKVYDNYMSNRQSGATDAYGNRLSSRDNQGGGSYKDPNKVLSQPKAPSQMDNTGVKSNLISAKGPTSAEMSEDANMIDIKRRGRKTTMLTDINKNEKTTLSKKVLLGT